MNDIQAGNMENFWQKSIHKGGKAIVFQERSAENRIGDLILLC